MICWDKKNFYLKISVLIFFTIIFFSCLTNSQNVSNKKVKVEIKKSENINQNKKPPVAKDEFTYNEPVPPGAMYSFFSFIKSIFSLGIVIVLIYLSIFALKIIFTKKNILPAGQNIALLESFYLAPQKILYLITVADKILLIAANEKGINLLLEIEGEEFKKKILANLNLDKKKETENLFEGILGKFQKKFTLDQSSSKSSDELQELKQNIEKLKDLNK